jgi:hypothetical protein
MNPFKSFAVDRSYVQLIKKQIDNIANYSKVKFVAPLSKKQDNVKKWTIHETNSDSLWWIFYILRFDVPSYLDIHKNTRDIFAIQEKIKYIELIRDLHKQKIAIPPLFKRILSYSSIEEQLTMNQSNITFDTFLYLCATFTKENVIYIRHKMYFQLNPDIVDDDTIINDNSLFHIITAMKPYDRNVFQYEIVPYNKVSNYLNGLFPLETPTTKMYCMSHYKVQDLVDMCQQMNIPHLDENGKNFKKEILYHAIQTQLEL